METIFRSVCPESRVAPDGPARVAAITTRGLTKSYGQRRAVDGLDLDIPDGVVCGFVGPNGAGKTTTIRMLLGLVRPTDGTGTVLGTPIGHSAAYLPRVGAMIEGPAFHPTLSARDNLRLLAHAGSLPVSRVGDAQRTELLVSTVDRSALHVVAGLAAGPTGRRPSSRPASGSCSLSSATTTPWRPS